MTNHQNRNSVAMTEERIFEDSRTGCAVPIQVSLDTQADEIYLTIQDNVLSLSAQDAGDLGVCLKYLSDRVTFDKMGF